MFPGAVPSDFPGDAAGLRRAAVLGDNRSDTRLEKSNLALNYNRVAGPILRPEEWDDESG